MFNLAFIIEKGRFTAALKKQSFAILTKMPMPTTTPPKTPSINKTPSIIEMYLTVWRYSKVPCRIARNPMTALPIYLILWTLRQWCSLSRLLRLSRQKAKRRLRLHHQKLMLRPHLCHQRLILRLLLLRSSLCKDFRLRLPLLRLPLRYPLFGVD